MHDVRKLQILRTHYNHQFGMDMRRHGETALWPLHLIYTYSGLPCTKGRWDRISKKHQLRWHRCIKIFDSPFKSLSNQLDLNYTVIFLIPLPSHPFSSTGTHTHTYTPTTPSRFCWLKTGEEQWLSLGPSRAMSNFTLVPAFRSTYPGEHKWIRWTVKSHLFSNRENSETAKTD